MTTAVDGVLLEAALGYARLGWQVLPLHNPMQGMCSCRNQTCKSIGKHPRIKRWREQATTSEDIVRRWWKKWPQANIGIATGSASGIVVVDVDDKNGYSGSESLERLEQRDGKADTLTVLTGNGEHLYFSSPSFPVRGSVGLLGRGLDIRADGNYVVAPPSLHANGNTYSFDDPRASVSECPMWLRLMLERMNNKETMDSHQKVESNGVEPTEYLAEVAEVVIREGQRNQRLFEIGCSLRGQHGKTYEDIRRILLLYNRYKTGPPLEESEVSQIAKQAAQYKPDRGTRKPGSGNPLWWFQFNVREWAENSDVFVMRDFQRGWLISLMAWAWRQGGTLTAEPEQLWKLAGAETRDVFEANCGPVLKMFDSVSFDGKAVLLHPRLAEAHADAIDLWMLQKRNGEKSALARGRERQDAVAVH